jgi:hypothetical protein
MAYGSRNFQREGPNPRRTDFGDLFCSLLETFTPQLSFCCPISSSHAVSATLSATCGSNRRGLGFHAQSNRVRMAALVPNCRFQSRFHACKEILILKSFSISITEIDIVEQYLNTWASMHQTLVYIGLGIRLYFR